jgi:hypothetical protein
MKLVVEELAEGLREGDTINELQDLVRTIPTELAELYERTLRRPRRASTQVKTRNRDEAYVMFQIALFSLTPLHVKNFMMAVFMSTSQTDEWKQIQGQSSEEFQPKIPNIRRRLNSRCGGLLVLSEKSNVVQFIHQTVKEFMLHGTGIRCLYEEPNSIPKEDGHVFMLRYFVWPLSSFPDPSSIFEGQPIFYHARHAELASKVSIPKCWEDLIARVGASKTIEKIHTFLDQSWINVAWVTDTGLYTQDLRRAHGHLREHEDPILSLLVILIFFYVPISVQDILQSNPRIVESHGSFLLSTAHAAKKHYDLLTWDDGFGVVKALRAAGITTDSTESR